MEGGQARLAFVLFVILLDNYTAPMSILVRRSKEEPAWLDQTRDFCRRAGISVTAWGPNILTVEANSSERAKEIANQLGQLGFKVVKDKDDEDAGLLNLSLDPDAIEAAVHERIMTFDISRRRWGELVEPVVWLAGSSLLIPGVRTTHTAGAYAHFLGFICLMAFFWDAARMWGWRIELLPEELRVRRYFRWATIPWNQIRDIESVSAGHTQEALVLKLVSRKSWRLGTFDVVYARNTRDRLRQEIAQHNAFASH